MSVPELRNSALALALAALAVPLASDAQVREVTSKEVSVGRTEATLRLEFADEGRFEVSFHDGRVLVDGDVVGSYVPGDELEAAWRELLGEAVRLDDGPLAVALADWTVPADLAGEMADLAQEIDQALEDALAELDIRVDVDRGSVSVSLGDERSLVQVVLRSLSSLGVLQEALADIDGELMIHVDEDVTVPAGAITEGTLVVIGGTARIEGEVEGDVIVINGALDLREGGRIDGTVRLAESRILRNDGRVTDEIVDLLERERAAEDQLREEIRRDVEREVRADLRNEIRQAVRGDDSGFSLLAPFRPVVRAVGGIAEKIVLILILALIGAAVLVFAGDNLDVVAETARRAPGRSAMVGLAGTILLIPVWVLGTVALAASIIFLPVAIAWLPLFPLAAAFAALVGYLAVARNTGEWLANSEYPWTGWIRKSNSWVAMVGGLVGLMLAFVVAHVVSIAPFLDFLAALLVFVGCAITIAAIQVGFGAVLLTRAGRRREHWYDPDAAWEAAMSVDVESDGEGGNRDA